MAQKLAVPRGPSSARDKSQLETACFTNSRRGGRFPLVLNPETDSELRTGEKWKINNVGKCDSGVLEFGVDHFAGEQ